MLNRPLIASAEAFDQELSIQQSAAWVLELLAQRRATWNQHHVLAEAAREVRELPAVQQGWWPVTDAAQAVTSACLAESIRLTPPEATPTPSALSRADGTSVYVPHGTTRYTSRQVLDAERELRTAAQRRAGFVVSASVFESAVADLQIDTRRRLDASQLEMARRFACSSEQLVVGIGPAGTGKTTAMAAFVAAVRDAGGRVVAVGPSAVAARVLGDELGVAAETLHKLIDQHERGGKVPEHLRVDGRTVLLVDEAGMAGTPELQSVLQLAQRSGASVRLLGDPAQLGAVGAGGALRLIANTVGAAELRDIHRFTTPGEDMAGLLIRDGRTAGLDFYIDHDRVHTGSRESALEDLHAAWAEDIAAGDNSILIAATNEDVAYLNERARLRRVSDQEVAPDGVRLGDGTTAGVGDVVVTRHNDRMLRHGSTDYVKNGDLWTVTGVRADGALHLQHRAHRTRTVLPADYVKDHVQLGYATTVHRCQGMTVDVARMLVDDSMAREQLYTGITRGRRTNHLYVVTEELLDTSLHHQAEPSGAARDVLEAVLTRTAVDDGAIATAINEAEALASLATLVPAYEDAYATALDPGAMARMGDALRAACSSERADCILHDDAWPHLAGLVYRFERSGGDLTTMLAEGVEGLDGARSPAALLAWQLDEPGVVGDACGLPGWITPPPADDGATSATEDQAVAAWLRDRAQRIGERLDVLTRRVAERPPVWAAALPPVPAADIPERIVWEHHVRQIVAYRDRYAVDGYTPLGRAAAPDGLMGRARTAAQRALEALGATDTAPTGDEREPLLQNERDRLLEQAEGFADDVRGPGLDLLDPMHHGLDEF